MTGKYLFLITEYIKHLPGSFNSHSVVDLSQRTEVILQHFDISSSCSLLRNYYKTTG